MPRATFYAAGCILMWSLGAPAAAEDARLYCFSDICPGDPPAALKSIALRDLARVAVSKRADAKGQAVQLQAALPDLSAVARATLIAYAAADGALLLDAHTLPIVLGAGRVCAPVGPFDALFSSESGHLTSVTFAAVAANGVPRLGVSRVTRAFKVWPGSTTEKTLLADLSAKFKFPVDGAKPHVIDAASGLTATYEGTADGFQLSFAVPVLGNDAQAWSAPTGRATHPRIKID